jgi:hypothetical protein
MMQSSPTAHAQEHSQTQTTTARAMQTICALALSQVLLAMMAMLAPSMM